MDPIEETHFKYKEIGQLGEEIQRLMSSVQPSPETGNSFTALLELPANKAVQLLDSSETGDPPATLSAYQLEHQKPYRPTFPSNTGLIDRALKFSVFTTSENSPETSSILTNFDMVKQEPVDSYLNPNSSPVVSDSTALKQNQKSSAKRKEREKKVNVIKKKSKSNEKCEDGEKLPYVHVRARRGEATDSHSLAERARREKINARMKLLQELVPGCNKISGTATVLDEIINHVQSLQRQVEFLSMRLAAVNPRIDFDLDSIVAAEGGSITDSSFPMMVMPSLWPEGQVNGNQQQYQQLWNFDELHQQPVWGTVEDNNPNFITMENSRLSYDSSANSAPLHANQLKMEI